MKKFYVVVLGLYAATGARWIEIAGTHHLSHAAEVLKLVVAHIR